MWVWLECTPYSTPHFDHAPAQVAQSEALVELARSKGVPIVYTQVKVQYGQSSPRQPSTALNSPQQLTFPPSLLLSSLPSQIVFLEADFIGLWFRYDRESTLTLIVGDLRARRQEWRRVRAEGWG